MSVRDTFDQYISRDSGFRKETLTITNAEALRTQLLSRNVILSSRAKGKYTLHDSECLESPDTKEVIRLIELLKSPDRRREPAEFEMCPRCWSNPTIVGSLRSIFEVSFHFPATLNNSLAQTQISSRRQLNILLECATHLPCQLCSRYPTSSADALRPLKGSPEFVGLLTLLQHTCVLQGSAVAASLSSIISLMPHQMDFIRRSIDASNVRSLLKTDEEITELARLIIAAKKCVLGERVERAQLYPFLSAPTPVVSFENATLVLWDVESIRGALLGSSFKDAIGFIHAYAKTNLGCNVRSILVFSAQEKGADHPFALTTSESDTLSRLGCTVRFTASKRQSSDRGIEDALVKVLQMLTSPNSGHRTGSVAATELPPKSILIMSSERTHAVTSRQLMERGIIVHTVHCAGSDHAQQLAVSCTRCLSFDELVQASQQRHPSSTT